MRLAYVTFALVFASSCGVRAQVINGESTYENNYLHTPPDPNASPGPQSRTNDTSAKAAPVPSIDRREPSEPKPE